MKHAFRHFARTILLEQEGESSTGGGSIDRTPSANTQDRGINSVDAAMAELDRRESNRKAAKRAEKLEASEDEGDDDGDVRRVEKKAKKEQDRPERNLKADATSDEDAADDDESDGEDEDDADDELSDDSETPDDDAEADDREDGESQRPKALDDDTEIEIEHADGKQKVKLSELRKGYLRQSDFTQKTTQLAQERQTVNQAAAQITATLQQLHAQQQQMAQFTQAMLGDEPSIDLATSDPTAYTVQKAIYDQRARALQAIQQQANQTQQQQQALQQQQMAMHAMQQAQTLVQALPELRDPKKREAFTRDVVEGAAKYGFSAQDVGQVTDHRMLLLLRDLATLQRSAQRSQQAQESVRKKLANVPPKLIKPGAANADQGKNQRRAEAKAKFLRSGKTLKDALRVLSASD